MLWRRGAVGGFGDGGEAGVADARAQSIEMLEAHDERASLVGVDAVGVACELDGFVDVDALDVDFEGDEAAAEVGGLVGDGVDVFEGGFEVGGALKGARRLDRF